MLAFARYAILFLIFTISAGNVTNSFLLKWGFRDKGEDSSYLQTYSLTGMMNGTAPRPYVYRSTIVQLIKKGVDKIDPDVQAKLFMSITRYDSLRNSYFNGIPMRYWTPPVAITYHITYLLVYWTFFISLIFLFKIAKHMGQDYSRSLLSVVAFCFIYPLIFQQGGYYYDFFELLGLVSTAYFTLKRKFYISTFLVFIFAFNKETFFLVPLALFFLYDDKVGLKTKIFLLLTQLVFSLSARHYIMSGYEGNTGGLVEWHLWENFLFWIDPRSYFGFYNLVGKGVFTPALENPIIAIPLLIFYTYAWGKSENRYKFYFWAALIPVLCLSILFGFRDEFRNLSLAIPAAFLIALSGVSDFSKIFAMDENQESNL